MVQSIVGRSTDIGLSSPKIFEMRNAVIKIFLFIDCLAIGGYANGTLIKYSSQIIPPPVGCDLSTEQGLLHAMSIMEPKHFIIPFLAHALGTLISSFLVTWLVEGKGLLRALLVGFIFMFGGAYMVFILPSPLWFDALDLGLAYIPMAWLGYKLALRISK